MGEGALHRAFVPAERDGQWEGSSSNVHRAAGHLVAVYGAAIIDQPASTPVEAAVAYEALSTISRAEVLLIQAACPG
jgi:hypothetical protein